MRIFELPSILKDHTLENLWPFLSNEVKISIINTYKLKKDQILFLSSKEEEKDDCYKMVNIIDKRRNDIDLILKTDVFKPGSFCLRPSSKGHMKKCFVPFCENLKPTNNDVELINNLEGFKTKLGEFDCYIYVISHKSFTGEIIHILVALYNIENIQYLTSLSSTNTLDVLQWGTIDMNPALDYPRSWYMVKNGNVQNVVELIGYWLQIVFKSYSKYINVTQNIIDMDKKFNNDNSNLTYKNHSSQ